MLDGYGGCGVRLLNGWSFALGSVVLTKMVGEVREMFLSLLLTSVNPSCIIRALGLNLF